MKWHQIHHEGSHSGVEQVVQSSGQNRVSYSRLLRNVIFTWYSLDSEYLQGQTQEFLGQVVQVHNHDYRWKWFSFFLSGISCVSVCAHCLLSCRCEPLTKTSTLFSLHQVLGYMWIKSLWAFTFPVQPSQHLLIWQQFLQALHHLHGPLLVYLQWFRVSLVVGSPEQNVALTTQVLSRPCVKDHVPSLAGSGLPNALKMTLISLLTARNPTAFYGKTHSSQPVLEFFLQWDRSWYFLCWGYQLRLLSACFSSLSGSLLLAEHPFACRPSSHICVICRPNEK